MGGGRERDERDGPNDPTYACRYYFHQDFEHKFYVLQHTHKRTVVTKILPVMSLH